MSKDPNKVSVSSSVPPRQSDATNDLNMSDQLNKVQHDIEKLLGQANLLRLRGEFEGAVAICNQALDLAPTDPDALALLGDIKYEGGQFEDAIHFYGLALAESPERPGLSEKLARTEEALQSEQSDAGAAQIGLPKRSLPAWLIPSLLIGSALLLGLAAYLAGAKTATPSVYKEPISIPVQTTTSSPVTSINPARSSSPNEAPVADSKGDTGNPSSTGPTQTNEALGRFKGVLDLRSALEDPRSESAVLGIIRPADQGNLADSAVTTASGVFAKFPDLQKLTIHVLDAEGRSIYIADFTRDNPSRAINDWDAPQNSNQSSTQPSGPTGISGSVGETPANPR